MKKENKKVKTLFLSRTSVVINCMKGNEMFKIDIKRGGIDI